MTVIRDVEWHDAVIAPDGGCSDAVHVELWGGALVIVLNTSHRCFALFTSAHAPM